MLESLSFNGMINSPCDSKKNNRYKHMKKLLLLLAIFIAAPIFSQEVEEKPEKRGNKGKMYVIWGWNRGHFSDSDIRFKGENYDFTLYDVKAKDKVNAFTFRDYINPGRITIPQTNYRVGYFFTITTLFL